METKNRKRDLETLEYVLDDFLELKVCLDAGKTEAVKQLLFSQPLNGHQVSSIEGFLLGHQLVVFHKGDPGTLNQLIFLRPEDGKMRVKRLQGAMQEN